MNLRSYFKKQTIILITATKDDGVVSNILLFEYYPWIGYKKKLYYRIKQEQYKGYQITNIKKI